jgi:hypothetical protein
LFDIGLGNIDVGYRRQNYFDIAPTYAHKQKKNTYVTTLVRRFMHFGKKFFSRNGKFYPRTGNPPSAYKQLSSKSSYTGKIAGPGQTFLFTVYQGCQLWGFFS